MWVFAAVTVGLFAIGWITSRSKPTRNDAQRKRAEYEVALLRCDLGNAIGEAQRWFEMDLPKPAWDSISDAFSILEALRPRIERVEWTALEAQLLVAIPRVLDAQPSRSKRRRLRVSR